jgi:hypothetical protein
VSEPSISPEGPLKIMWRVLVRSTSDNIIKYGVVSLKFVKSVRVNPIDETVKEILSKEFTKI